jgi:hypothetical protein
MPDQKNVLPARKGSSYYINSVLNLGCLALFGYIVSKLVFINIETLQAVQTLSVNFESGLSKLRREIASLQSNEKATETQHEDEVETKDEDEEEDSDEEEDPLVTHDEEEGPPTSES